MNWLKRGLFFLVVLGVVAVGGAWLMARKNGGDTTFRTAAIARGEVVSTIGATGVVQPEEVVDVGAQVAGQIEAFGKDVTGQQIDHGSRVAKDALLAQIDDSLYRSDVEVAKAQLTAAKAGVARAEADLKQAQARYYQAERDWQRAQKLGPSEALAEFSYDAYKAAYEGAAAAVAVSQAAIDQAKGNVAQAEASLFREQRDLGYTVIKSPIDGVIIERRVNIGQTVVASLNAPSLFLLAKDLTNMQVWVSVNEADIGRIHPGQPVSFGVDTFPGRTFRGTVRKVRPKAEMSQNVVTYLVEVATDNSDGTLWPYLTANVQFEVNRREMVLNVPNAALRYIPDADRVAPDARDAWLATQAKPDTGETRREGGGGGGGVGGGERESSGPGKGGGGGGGRGKGKGKRGGVGAEPTSRPAADATTRPVVASFDQPRPGTVWVRDGEFVRPVPVMAGVTDGIVTEITGDGIAEGTEVVTGEETADERAKRGGSTNPFAPTNPWSRRR